MFAGSAAHDRIRSDGLLGNTPCAPLVGVCSEFSAVVSVSMQLAIHQGGGVWGCTVQQVASQDAVCCAVHPTQRLHRDGVDGKQRLGDTADPAGHFRHPQVSLSKCILPCSCEEKTLVLALRAKHRQLESSPGQAVLRSLDLARFHHGEGRPQPSHARGHHILADSDRSRLHLKTVDEDGHLHLPGGVVAAGGDEEQLPHGDHLAPRGHVVADPVVHGASSVGLEGQDRDGFLCFAELVVRLLDDLFLPAALMAAFFGAAQHHLPSEPAAEVAGSPCIRSVHAIPSAS
mmetsp:Transcript_36697/g.84441  ORF Transcript_36697/g.84441 Transcript_36697/m.84441 type:complete len:288 (+) Transcript_36697:410-1273(+)